MVFPKLTKESPYITQGVSFALENHKKGVLSKKTPKWLRLTQKLCQTDPNHKELCLLPRGMEETQDAVIKLKAPPKIGLLAVVTPSLSTQTQWKFNEVGTYSPACAAAVNAFVTFVTACGQMSSDVSTSGVYRCGRSGILKDYNLHCIYLTSCGDWPEIGQKVRTFYLPLRFVNCRGCCNFQIKGGLLRAHMCFEKPCEPTNL